MSKPTPARKACDRAANACAKAYDAMADLARFLPDSVSDTHSRWVSDLRSYTEHLEKATWPDKVQP